MTAIMTKEDWIKSRTNTPDRLGRKTWENFYDLILKEQKGSKVLSISQSTLKPLYMDMAREYLEKLGISCKVNDSNWKIIFGYMKNTDSIQKQEAIRMGLSVSLGLGIPTPKKHIPPAKAPKPSSDIMTKEDWIKSRTNNPNRLGKEAWGALYDLTIQGKDISKEKALKPFLTEMVKEYFEKSGLSYNFDYNHDSNGSNWTAILAMMSSTSKKQSLKNYQAILNALTSQKPKKSPVKKPIDILIEKSKKFFEKR